MKKGYLIIIALLVLAGLLTAFEGNMERKLEGKSECGNRSHQKHEPGIGMREMHRFKELELSESQTELLNELILENKKSMIQKKAELEMLQLDKTVALKDKDFMAAKKITADIYAIKQEMAIKKIELHEDQWNLLTEEQKQKAEEMNFERKHSTKNRLEGRGLKKGM